MKRQQVVEGLLAQKRRAPRECGEAFAPSNIALCKYWGKRNAELNLPVNSSLSISLGNLGTRTVVRFAEASDRILLNQQPAPRDFAARLSAYLDLFRPAGQFFDVCTENNIPTAAGLASSASGFAALSLALDRLMGWELAREELSILARLGSGSATRSLYHGFVVWHAGQRSDGMDSVAEPLLGAWSDLRIGILSVSSDRKSVGSTEGMNRTRETSELYHSWHKQAACDFDALRTAIASRDFPMLGQTAENNALAMHATMLSAWPPLCYWLPDSLAAMQAVWRARAEGLELYFTMDAGPNLKLLFLQADEAAVCARFPSVRVVNPWGGHA